MDKPIIFIDGQCHLCHGAVQFVATRDRNYFYFSSLQGKLAQELINKSGNLDSVVVFDRGRVFTKSCAALYIGEKLKFPWNLFARLLKIIPKSLRDSMYELIANNRYRWFGKKSECQYHPAISTERILD